MALPVQPPVKPMLAKAVGDQLPDGDGLMFEPKWDGFRCLVFRDGDTIELTSRNTKPFLRYVPELAEPLMAQLPEQCVVDGELVVVTDGELDFDALQQRIHPAKSRIDRLASETPTSYIAFDLLALGDRDLTREPFVERRRLLRASLQDARPPVYLTPMTTDRDQAREWFRRFEGAGLDGLIAKPPDGTYQENKRAQFKVKHKRTVDCVVAGYRLHKAGDGPGSFLLGIYGDDGRLNHVGVATSFSAKRRAELVDEIDGLEADDLADHPWGDWADAASHDGSQRKPGSPSRWNADKDLSFVPLRIERVMEVAYEGLLNGRIRHSARMVRWRPDRDPESCTYDQFETPEPLTVGEIFR
jgi:ATP-dependent DNA ligase